MKMVGVRSLIDCGLNWVYPPICVHCRGETKGEWLCCSCGELLMLLNPYERCPRCFSLECSARQKVRGECFAYQARIRKMASALPYEGPIISLIHKFKYENKPFLSRGLGAFMVAQFVELNWPIPDVVVPVPQSFFHWLQRGFNQSALLAKILAQSLGCSFANPLKRYVGDYPQAALKGDERRQLTASSFACKKKASLMDKRILLVDDVQSTGSTLKVCAQVLAAHYPSEIYSLTLCRVE